MSHALYRKGNARNLASDFVILATTAKGINDAGGAARIRRFLEIARRYHPANLGETATGSSYQMEVDDIAAQVWDTSMVHAVFTDPAVLAALLKELKEADLGLSVTVSGLFETLGECCGRAGLHPYGIEQSLGIIGRVERLPSEPVLEIATMCGHGLVSTRLIEALAQQIREGETTPEDGAREMARQCVCGIFNPVRAKELLEAMAGES
ncbi:MAG: hypothetical protein M1531_05975 [Chloroflexi bacterium]|nr:hypothetical protein [Chloroflexota bacterium]